VGSEGQRYALTVVELAVPFWGMLYSIPWLKESYRATCSMCGRMRTFMPKSFELAVAELKTAAVSDGGGQRVERSLLATDRPICLRLLTHCERRAASRAAWTAGRSRAIRTAMMAITTSNSIRVKPRRLMGRPSLNLPERPRDRDRYAGVPS